MENQSSSLFAKVARVMGKVQHVTKDATHGQGWKYAGDEVIYTAVRQHLADEGLAVIPSIVDIQDNGTKMLVRFEIKLVCGESGEVMTSTWAAESFSKDDKAVNKCATVAMKYFLKTTFLIATGDPDDDGDSNTAPKGGQQSKRTQSEAPAPERKTAPAGEKPAQPANVLTMPQPSEKPQGNAPDLTPLTPEQRRGWFQAKLADKGIPGAMQGSIPTGQQANLHRELSTYIKAEGLRYQFWNHHFGSEERVITSASHLHEKEFLVFKKFLNETDPTQIVAEVELFRQMVETEFKQAAQQQAEG